MEKCKARENHSNSSFSSTLLDAMYRSIDEGEGGRDDETLILYRSAAARRNPHQAQQNNNHSRSTGAMAGEEAEIARLRRAIMITEKLLVPRSSAVTEAADPDQNRCRLRGRTEIPSLHSSSSTSSDSINKKSENHRTNLDSNFHPPKPKHGGGGGGGFVKTKSKSAKIPGDPKKVKKPISPGARLARFLNSLFTTAGNVRKSKMSSSSPSSPLIRNNHGDESSPEGPLKYAHAPSTYSSPASSFSRSCLSKAPTRKFTAGERLVRFYPVCTVIDEDSHPHDQNFLYRNQDDRPTTARKPTNGEEELDFPPTKSYQKKDGVNRGDILAGDEDSDGGGSEESDDGGGSCTSSDLFELDHLSAIGIDGYEEELPVYETTHPDTNRAIASGLIL